LGIKLVFTLLAYSSIKEIVLVAPLNPLTIVVVSLDVASANLLEHVEGELLQTKPIADFSLILEVQATDIVQQ
jgi:hypothetical protein